MEIGSKGKRELFVTASIGTAFIWGDKNDRGVCGDDSAGDQP
jgi:hypothetical protein